MGQLDGTKQSKITHTSRAEYQQDDVTIGGLWNNCYLFDGRIDDVRIYNRALSAKEIGELAGLGEPPKQKN